MSNPLYEKSWKKPLLKERNDKICRLWEEGMTFADLAERFGLCYDYVREIVKRGSGKWTRNLG